MSFQRKMQRNIWKHIGNKKGKRFFNRFPLIYANNEPKSVLARDLGDCRDNLRNSRSVFLIVRDNRRFAKCASIVLFFFESFALLHPLG